MKLATEFKLDVNYTNEDIPDELGGFSYIGRLIAIGFANTPQSKVDAAASRGDVAPQRMFVLGWEPLDIEYDTNKESFLWEQQGNNRVNWVKYLDKTGKIISANSPFGDIKDAFRKLGYQLRNEADCAALRGKVFRVLAAHKKYIPTADKETYTDIPTEEMPAGYTFEGDRRVFKRGYEGAESAATRVDPLKEREDTQKLVEVLDGKAPHEFILSILKAGLNSPYLDEAVDDGTALISRMTKVGMQFNNGVLSK
jgi:hypothetical protein